MLGTRVFRSSKKRLSGDVTRGATSTSSKVFTSSVLMFYALNKNNAKGNIISLINYFIKYCKKET